MGLRRGRGRGARDRRQERQDHGRPDGAGPRDRCVRRRGPRRAPSSRRTRSRSPAGREPRSPSGWPRCSDDGDRGARLPWLPAAPAAPTPPGAAPEAPAAPDPRGRSAGSGRCAEAGRVTEEEFLAKKTRAPQADLSAPPTGANRDRGPRTPPARKRTSRTVKRRTPPVDHVREIPRMARGSEASTGARSRRATRSAGPRRRRRRAHRPAGRVLRAVAAGVETAFGLEVVVNLLDPETDRFTVRAVSAGPAELLGHLGRRPRLGRLLDPPHEIARDVFFVPHDAGVAEATRSAPPHAGSRMERARPLASARHVLHPACARPPTGSAGSCSVDSSWTSTIPDEATVRAAAAFRGGRRQRDREPLLSTEIAALEAERRMRELRRELEEEVDLRRSLLAIGERLGAASAAARRDLPMLVERLGTVVPIKSLTVWARGPPCDASAPSTTPSPAIAEAVMSYRFDFGVGATGQAVIRSERATSRTPATPAQVRVHIPGERRRRPRARPGRSGHRGGAGQGRADAAAGGLRGPVRAGATRGGRSCSRSTQRRRSCCRSWRRTAGSWPRRSTSWRP